MNMLEQRMIDLYDEMSGILRQLEQILGVRLNGRIRGGGGGGGHHFGGGRGGRGHMMMGNGAGMHGLNGMGGMGGMGGIGGMGPGWGGGGGLDMWD